MIKGKSISLVFCLSLILFTISSAFAASVDGKASTQKNDKVFYIFGCAGSYKKVDISTGRILAEGMVGNIEPMSRFDGCPLESVLEDPDSGMIYALVTEDQFMNAESKQHYSIIALKNYNLAITAKHEIEIALESIPDLYFDPSKHELVLHYYKTDIQSEENIGVLERYSPSNLTKISTQENFHLAGQVNRFNKRGEIYEGSRILDANGKEKKMVDGYSLLNDAIKDKFKKLYRPAVDGTPYLDITFADSSDGKMVFAVAWDIPSERSPNGGGVVVYDAFQQQIISSFTTVYQITPSSMLQGPTVHISPNGKLIVVEQYIWKKSKNARPDEVKLEFKTGKLAIYDADSGIQKGTIILRPSPGFGGHVVNFSEDGRYLFYKSKNKVYVVDLNALKILNAVRFKGDDPIKVLPAQIQ